MTTENKTTQTTEPAIAVEPVLGKVNYNTVDESHLEPYIGWEFKVLKHGKTVSWIAWFGKTKKVDNIYFNFA